VLAHRRGLRAGWIGSAFYRERQEILIDRAKRAMLYGEKDV